MSDNTDPDVRREYSFTITGTYDWDVDADDQQTAEQRSVEAFEYEFPVFGKDGEIEVEQITELESGWKVSLRFYVELDDRLTADSAYDAEMALNDEIAIPRSADVDVNW